MTLTIIDIAKRSFEEGRTVLLVRKRYVDGKTNFKRIHSRELEYGHAWYKSFRSWTSLESYLKESECLDFDLISVGRLRRCLYPFLFSNLDNLPQGLAQIFKFYFDGFSSKEIAKQIPAPYSHISWIVKIATGEK